MAQHPLPAYFMRGGTSKALMVLKSDLPTDQEQWAPIFCAAMGSPDPYGRQLNGMGGGVSSLSKVCIIGPSERPDIDVEYTFAQVAVGEQRVDYRGNCGNMSSAVGPFAVHTGLVSAPTDTTTVRILNTNTNKVIESTFATPQGVPQYAGTLTIPGVSGAGSPIELRFIEPGGATTGKLLPTSAAVNQLDIPDVGEFSVSYVDAANAAVFLRATELGLKGTELPDELEANTQLMRRLEQIRQHASVAMGITKTVQEAAEIKMVPFVCILSTPQENPTLQKQNVPASDLDLVARVISNGQPHRALPLTISLCIAVAANIKGTIANQLTRPTSTGEGEQRLRLGNPSGVLEVRASVERDAQQRWYAHYGAFDRTARLLFSGDVWVPKHSWPA
ncbi:MAG TPA: PrpF domain-containing protein [Paenalcaligenes sp.]|nr:PrpF domain-containing protein [Paenalcaligenes sp.]